MKISSKKPTEPTILTISLETPEELRLFGQMSTYCLSIPSLMGLKGEEYNTVRMMLQKIASEIVEL
jgi:hypothetical protein